MGFPGSSDGKEYTCNEGDLGLIPGLGRSPGGGHGNPTPVFLPRESPWTRSLVGYSPRGCKESDTTERLTHSTCDETSTKVWKITVSKRFWVGEHTHVLGCAPPAPWGQTLLHSGPFLTWPRASVHLWPLSYPLIYNKLMNKCLPEFCELF